MIAAAWACGLVGAAMAVESACITAPPPQLPVEPEERPTILHDSVSPPADVPLVEWPAGDEFIVPIQLDDQNEQFCWDVFIDYNPYGTAGGTGLVPSGVTCETAPPSALDGGVFPLSFTLGEPDPGTCHRIQFNVAHAFESDSHTPDSIGGDSITWTFVPGGGPDCPAYDAGVIEDGGTSAADAPLDGLPVTPPDSSGGL